MDWGFTNWKGYFVSRSCVLLPLFPLVPVPYMDVSVSPVCVHACLGLGAESQRSTLIICTPAVITHLLLIFQSGHLHCHRIEDRFTPPLVTRSSVTLLWCVSGWITTSLCDTMTYLLLLSTSSVPGNSCLSSTPELRLPLHLPAPLPTIPLETCQLSCSQLALHVPPDLILKRLIRLIWKRLFCVCILWSSL